MGLHCRFPGRGLERANKVYVNTKHSQDGRNLEGFWLDYDPGDGYALFLLETVLNASAGVESYSVYDASGARVPGVAEQNPKRV